MELTIKIEATRERVKPLLFFCSYVLCHPRENGDPVGMRAVQGIIFKFLNFVIFK
jgi:hypothetical protein